LAVTVGCFNLKVKLLLKY